MIYKNYDELCRKTRQMPPHTDLLAFTNLYKRFDIECKILEVPPNRDGTNKLYQIQLTGKDSFMGLHGDQATEHEVFNNSYNGFYTEIIFDENGKFLKQSFFE